MHKKYLHIANDILMKARWWPASTTYLESTSREVKVSEKVQCEVGPSWHQVAVGLTGWPVAAELDAVDTQTIRPTFIQI